MASATFTGTARPPESKRPLSEEELRKMHAYWRAANYLSVGQIYLLRQSAASGTAETRTRQAAVVRSLGHDPGLNFIYVHFNRLIKKYDLNVVYVTARDMAGRASSPIHISRARTAKSIRTFPKPLTG